MPVTLRSVRGSDAIDFYRWRRDPETHRFIGIPMHVVDWAEHLEWFTERLAASPPFWFVGEVDGEAIGSMRLDYGENGESVAGPWWISILLDRRWRGRGYGTRMLLLAPNFTIYARIHRFNVPSIRAFEKAGYVFNRDDDVWLIYRKEQFA